MGCDKLDDKKNKGAHRVSLFIDKNMATYFDSFDIEYIPQELSSKIKDKSVTYSIFRIRDDDSIMCGFYCITFIEYMLVGKILVDYTNFFSPNDYKKNDKLIYNSFKEEYGKPKF